jgi:hypothetical protein
MAGRTPRRRRWGEARDDCMFPPATNCERPRHPVSPSSCRPIRAAAAMLLLHVLVPACAEQSRIDPDAQIRVEGALQAPDGSPLADRPVRLGADISAGEGLFAVLTLGLSCSSGKCSGKVFDTTTNAAGSYAFTLKGRDTQSSFGEAVSELVSVSAAPTGQQVSGASLSARFRVQTEVVRLPVLRLVDPGLDIQTEGDVIARWSTEEPGPYVVTFERADPVPVWEVPGGAGTVAVDPRVLEDTSGRVVVAGGVDDAIEGSEVNIRWRSPGVAYQAGAGPPPSRGRPCRYVDAAGAPRATEPACEVTDGDVTKSAAPSLACPEPAAGPASTAGCTPPASVVTDLATPVPAELVVVRGCEEICAVDVSGDGTTFQTAGTASGDFASVGLGGRPVTAVRIGLGSATGAGLREVSVWGPRPATPALRLVGASQRDRLGERFGTASEGERSHSLLLVVAALLAGSVAVGTGYVIGRRST